MLSTDDRRRRVTCFAALLVAMSAAFVICPCSAGSFGQNGPACTPRLFAPGTVSEAGHTLHGFPTFTPDLKTVCWPVIPPAIMCARKVDGAWSEPKALVLEARGVQAPFFSVDGTRLYFQGVHADGHGSLDIMYADWSDAGPGEVHVMGAPVNSESLESQPTLSEDGTLCFAGHLDGVGWERGIYTAALEDSGRCAPELLGPDINSEYIDVYPFLTKGGDCLLFASSRPEMEESLHLRVSFADTTGEWSPSINLSEALGLVATARFPSVSPDGSRLMYMSEGAIYWVDFEIVESLNREEQ